MESLNGFDVVVEDFRFGVTHGLNTVSISLEVWGQDLDDAEWVFFVEFLNSEGKLSGTLVGKVVSGDTGDDNVLKSEIGGDFGNVGWFVGIYS